MENSNSHAPGRAMELVVPVLHEELEVGTRQVETGRVRINKQVSQREEVVEEPLMQEQVIVERVPINKVWEGPAPSQRYEADKLIIPVLEEVLVFEKRLMLKEEIHITRAKNIVQEPQTVVLRSEHVTVERVEASGSTEDAQTPKT